MLTAPARTARPALRLCATRMSSSLGPNINRRYQPCATDPLPKFTPKDNKSQVPDLSAHDATAWSSDQIQEALRKHSVFTWGASGPLLKTCVPIERAEGVYMYDFQGKQYIDWGSQAVCSNLGHTVPERVLEAAQAQMRKLCYAYGDLATTEIRARFCDLLGRVLPGDLNGVMCMSSGAEANEAAIRMARRLTGRPKIMSRNRSYHGGTTSTLAMTGDPRRWFVDGLAQGFVKIMDPYPFTFQWDADEEVGSQRCLQNLHEQILAEGPSSIAAIFLESICGANGWLKPPTSFMQGVRALCDHYGIMLVCDEVMTGFGRTGKMFGFENYDGVLPDMITFAKGVTGAYLPLSGVACRDHVFDHFRTNPIGYGSTYALHPVPLAVGYETIRYILDTNLVDHVREMEGVLGEELGKLVDAHPSAKQARLHGLGGGIDLGDKNGDFLCPMDKPTDGLNFFKERMREEGVMSLLRGHHLHCTPPLTITPDEIRDGCQRLDRCFSALDEFILKQ